MSKRKIQGIEQGNVSYKEIMTVPDLDPKNAGPAFPGTTGPFSDMKNALCKSRYIQILLVLTGISAVLRLYTLDLPSLWLDEALTYSLSLSSLSEYWVLISAGGEVRQFWFFSSSRSWKYHGQQCFA